MPECGDCGVFVGGWVQSVSSCDKFRFSSGRCLVVRSGAIFGRAFTNDILQCFFSSIVSSPCRYSASIGLTCESVQEFRFVLADGQEVKANSGGNTELFWASCGGGGGAFGVLTSVVIQTRDAAKFNQNVYFKYQWPEGVAGEVAHKAVNYDDEDGNLWVRIEFNLGQGATAYGVCWASGSVGDCEERLGQNAFYNVPGRSKVVAKAGADVTEYQKFIGPAGDWASTVPTMSNQQAFINTYGAEAGLGPSRSYNSMFVRYNSVPPQSVFDNMASTFFSLDRSVVAFNLIQFNPWRGAEKSSQPQFSFPHRDSDQLIEFIGGANSGNVDAGLAELRRGNAATQAAIAPWRSGIYINYPQFELADDEYPALYHGSSLPRLSALRGSLDPTGVFRQKQQIPGSGGGGAAVRSVVRSSDAAGQCSGLVALKSTGGLVEGKIHAYPFGYLSGVRAAVRVSAGCALRSPRGAGLATAAERPHHYEVLSEGGHEWSMEMVGEGCELSVVSVNRIECGME